MKHEPHDKSSVQNDTKPKKSKFRHESSTSKPSDKLRTEEEIKSSKKAAKETKKIDKSKFRAEKIEKKLDKAKEKLANHKPQKQPGIIKGVSQTTAATVRTKIHKKVYEVEGDNVGVESAHKAELAGESAIRAESRFIKRHIRSRPERKIQKLHKKSIRANADHRYRETIQQNPALRKKGIKRYVQKRRLRKLHAKNAKQAAKATKASARLTLKLLVLKRKITKAVILFIKTNPKLAIVILAFFMLIIIIQACFGSALSIGNTMTSAVAHSTYLAEDADMYAAVAAYTAMEIALQNQIDNFEANNPGYDEYHYDLDEIWYDPYVLISILSAKHVGAWTIAEVQGTLATLFDLQYTLTVTVTVEVRYRTEIHTETITEILYDDDGEPYTHTYTVSYEVEVPYDYYICHVTLENFNLSHLPVYIMDEEGLSRYAVYMATLGNRPDLFPTSLYPHASYMRDYEYYGVPPEALSDPVFATMLKEAEKFLGWPYVWGGSSPATSFDCSGYISWVINNTFWNVGRLGAKGLYNICTPISPAEAKPGDLVFFWKTYRAPDPNAATHVGLYVGNGMMIHCGNPISYASINTTYWQNHFFGFGRLP